MFWILLIIYLFIWLLVVMFILKRMQVLKERYEHRIGPDTCPIGDKHCQERVRRYDFMVYLAMMLSFISSVYIIIVLEM